jgi:serine/threonine protein phosphatase PrpC
MRIELVLTCPECSAAALADDEFCESCGTPLGPRRDAARHHFERDVGRAAAVSDRGLVHDRNEDAFFVAVHGDGVVAVVCDGVSASAAPQVAAAVAADAVGRALLEHVRANGGDRRDAVANALGHGDRAVLDVPWMPSGDRDAPSCTIVAALWEGSTATIGWAGDSRAYWVDANGARALTLDHSWAQEQVAAGAMHVAEAEADGRAHVITRWLGADSPPGEPATAEYDVAGPGRLVLCTDGLWNHLASPGELVDLVAEETGAKALDLARSLTATALARGGRDNVTVAVVDSPKGGSW